MTRTVAFEVKTFIDYHHNTIRMHVLSCRVDREELIANQLLQLQETAVRESLIRLGWMPPPEGWTAPTAVQVAAREDDALGDTSERLRDGYYRFRSERASEPSIAQLVNGEWFTINELGPITMEELNRRGWRVDSRV